jgi:arylsulfatase A-like enzyme/Tfp pilus assembly protein PilF
VRTGPLLALAVLALAGCARPPADAAERWRHGAAAGYDLLLVTLDTTRADHLGSYGNPDAETPNLDRLAREGVRFTDAITVAPLTLPSHSTILTGLLPPHHGVRNNSEFRLDARSTTLAELLGGSGYETAAFISAFVLDARFGTGRGFATYDDRVAAFEGPAFAPGTLERSAPRTTDAYLAWLARQAGDRKLFSWIHYFDAHAPFEPPPDLARRFAGRLYDGEIALVDRELGRVLAALERDGRLERTLVVVVADHGESLGDHGEVTHGLFIYDSTMRVPLIFRAPAALGTGVVDGRVVSTSDILPTIVDLLGVADPGPRDGESWVGRPVDPRRAVYLEALSPFLDFGWAPLVGLRTLRDKAIAAPRRELYDLADDPREEHDLLAGGAGSAGGRGAPLFARLDSEALFRPESVQPQTAPNAEDRARLQALGYIGGAGPAAAGESLADPKDRVVVHTALIEATAAMSTGNLALAGEWLRRATAASKDDRSVLFAQGKLALKMGQPAAAERFFRVLSAIQPRADVSILLAQIAMADGREAEAVARLEEAERLDPAHGGIFIARGDLLRQRGDRTGAEASYRRAIEVDPYRSAGMARARLESLRGARAGP